MTLINSWGGNGSNAYTTLTAANSIITTTIVGDVSAWTSATTAQKEASCVQATRQIDGLQYIGSRYYWDQLLEFPRELTRRFPYNYTDTATLAGDREQIRQQYHVEVACALQALFLLKNGGLPSNLENQAQGVQSFSEQLGPMSQSVNYGSGSAAAARAPERVLSREALSYLADYKTSRKIYRA